MYTCRKTSKPRAKKLKNKNSKNNKKTRSIPENEKERNIKR
jgi:hypothetical protein